jgi:hypothetical protein
MGSWKLFSGSLRGESGLSSPSSLNNIRREPRKIERIWFFVDDCGKTGVYPAYPEI